MIREIIWNKNKSCVRASGDGHVYSGLNSMNCIMHLAMYLRNVTRADGKNGRIFSENIELSLGRMIMHQVPKRY